MATTPGRATGKRRLVERALDLANEGRWDEAESVNREILARGKPDVAAMNRLGKALAEQHRYAEALDAYKQALEIDTTNQIADKNVIRLELLISQPLVANGERIARTQQARQTMFIEEPGRSATLMVRSDATPAVLAKMIPGDHLTLKAEGESVAVYTWEDELVGYLPAREGQRLAAMMESGNLYGAAVAAVVDGALRVVVRETYRSPENGARLSFPTSGRAVIAPRAYTRDVRRPTLEPDPYGDDGGDDDADDDDEELEPDAEDGEIAEDEELIEGTRRGGNSDEDELGT